MSTRHLPPQARPGILRMRRLSAGGTKRPGLLSKAGMQDSECIIAVNKNDTAPIFEIADYGICGDLFKVTPMLIEAIKAAKAAK